VEPLDGLDSAFLAMETPTSQFHIAAVLVMDPPEGRRSLFSPSTRFAQIRRQVAQRIHLVPAFRQRAVPVPFGLGHPVWADDPRFDLDDHLTRGALPAPGGLRELDQFVADVVSRPLQRDRPLWEMVVVEGLEGGRTALVAKVHHAILDGVSGASLLASFFDLGPRVPPTPLAEPAWDPPPLPSAAQLLRRGTGSLARRQGVALSAWRRVLPAALGAAAERHRPGSVDGPVAPFSAPRSPLNGAVSTRRRYASLDVALGDVRQVRTAFGVTVNDVILACVGEALHHLLDRSGQLPDRSLVAMVPVSTRDQLDRRLGNRLSAFLVPLGTDLLDPVERLWAVAEASRTAKAHQARAGTRLLADMADVSAPAIVAGLARSAGGLGVYDRLPPLANVTVSSVPGPSFPIWCAGGRVAALRPAGPVAHGIGLNITTFSYEQTLSFGLLGCHRLVPGLDDLAILLDSALGTLVMAAHQAQGRTG